MDSGVQEGDERRRGSLHRTTAFKAVILVSVLLLSTSVMSISGSLGTHSGRDAERGAHTSDFSSLTLEASPSAAFVNDTITFYANASSTNLGATLIFTIFYSQYLYPDFSINAESPVTVNTTGSPGQVVQTHVYNQTGNWTDQPDPYYYVELWVDDGFTNESYLMTVSVSVYVPPVNTPPTFKSYPACPPGTRANESKIISAFVADEDSDTITMFWEFGDGTNATNVTVATPGGVYFNQTHAWNPPRIPGEGNYTVSYQMNVSLSDGINPQVNYSTPANIAVPLNRPPDIAASASKTTISQMDQVNFTANASDYEGDPLTWTFNFSDGTVEVFHTGYTPPRQLVWQNATHAFASVRTYEVNISVTDIVWPTPIPLFHNVTQPLLITVATNTPPVVGPINTRPGAPLINGTLGYVDVTLSVQAGDHEGDIVTVTWDLGGGDIRTNVTGGGIGVAYRLFQTVRFIEVGSYTVSLTATDGRLGHAVTRVVMVNVSSNNMPPDLLYFDKGKYSGRDFAAPNETVIITIILTDLEHDSLQMSLDFGDGSPMMYWSNLTNYTNGNITIKVNHVYVKIGNYTAILLLTDNKIGLFNHTLTYTLPIDVDVPRVVVHMNWDWWDYTSLGLFLMIPIGSIAWVVMLRRQRKKIEDQGMSYDEWRLKKEIDSEGLSK